MVVTFGGVEGAKCFFLKLWIFGRDDVSRW